MNRTRHPRFLLIVLIMLCAVGASLVFGQNPDPQTHRPRKVYPAEDDRPDDILKIDTDLVSVDVVATDNEGRPIKNLKEGDFKAYLDGIEQPLSFFQIERRSGEPRPVAVVFAIDISGSMTGEEMQRLRSALKAFSAKLSEHPALYAAMAFGMNVKLIQNFTAEPTKL